MHIQHQLLRLGKQGRRDGSGICAGAAAAAGHGPRGSAETNECERVRSASGDPETQEFREGTIAPAGVGRALTSIRAGGSRLSPEQPVSN